MTAAIRYGFVRQVVQRKLHAHMSAVRRQQRQQQQQQQVTATAAAGAAGQPHGSAGEGAAAAPQADGDDVRPAKQPRLTPKPEPSGSLGQDAPAAAAAAGAADSGRQHMEGSGSRPGSRDSSKASNGTKPEPRPLPAEASRHSSGDSSSEPAPSGRRSQRREQASGDAAIPPEQLVGRRIKVWWQMDQAFYCGVVTVRVETWWSHVLRQAATQRVKSVPCSVTCVECASCARHVLSLVQENCLRPAEMMCCQQAAWPERRCSHDPVTLDVR
jgi:hypothetical protein